MRFLIIGGGSIGRRHIRNLQFLGYWEIFCLKRAFDKNFENENKVKVITDISELENKKTDAAIICTPTSLHTNGIEIAKKLNAAIFMEKPLIDNKGGLTEAKKLLKDYQHPFFIGFMLRYHPLVTKIISLLKKNAIGKVYSARFEFGSYLPYWHPWEDYRESYASKKSLGGGVINTITHELDLIQYFFGDPHSVQCSKANLGMIGIEAEEIAEAVFEYEDKLVSLHVDYLQKDYDRRIRILGEDGNIEWKWHDNKVVLRVHKQKDEIFFVEGFDVNQLYIDEIKDFLQLIESRQTQHSLNAEYAFANTRLMLAMHESANQNMKIKFNNKT